MHSMSTFLKAAKVLILILFPFCLCNSGFAEQYYPLGTGSLHFYNEIPFKTGLDVRVERTDFSFIPTYSMDLSGYFARKIHAIVAAAYSVHVPNGVLVGSLTVYYEDGTSDRTDLIMGENIAEWAYDRPENQCCLAHNKVTPAFSYWTNEYSDSYYLGRQFYVSIETEDSIPIDHLELSLNESSYTGQPDCPDSCIYYHGLEDWFRIHLNAVTLENSSSENSYCTVPYDSFDSEFIDLTKWGESDHSVREISDGKLRMNEYGTTWRSSTYLHLMTPVTGYLESKITAQSGSLVLGDGTGFARIGGYFYNSELDPGSYNAYVGNVWGDVRIVLESDNTLTAKATLWKSTAPDQSAGETLLDQEFSKSILFDTEYTLSMELSGSQLIFRCDNEEITYQIQTPVYAPYDPYQHLATRIYPESGSAVSLKALFDDVKIKKYIGDFNCDGDVDAMDLHKIILLYGTYGCGGCSEDLNGDDNIDEADIGIFAESFGVSH